MHKFPLFLVLISLCLFCFPTAATEISAGSVALNGIGQTAMVPITINQAADGLAGYTIDVSVADPSVAEIVAVDYPGWASLSQSTSLPAGEVRLKAVDVNREVEAGATNIPIATVTVKSQSAGSTTLQVSPVRMNDDNGARIPSSSAQSALTVTAPGSSSGSSGSGSSTGSSSGSTGGSSSASSGSSTGSSSGSTVGSSTGSSGSSPSGERTVQPVHTPDSWATGSSMQSQPSERTQENGDRVSPVSAQPANALDWVKANLLPFGIALSAVVLLLLFAVARLKTKHQIPDQMPPSSRRVKMTGSVSSSGLEEGEKNRAVSSIIDVLNEIDMQLSDLDSLLSTGGSIESLSMNEASAVVELFFVSCQMAEESIKRATEKGQISKLQVYDLNGQLSAAVKRMVNLSKKSEILASQLHQYGAEVGG